MVSILANDGTNYARATRLSSPNDSEVTGASYRARMPGADRVLPLTGTGMDGQSGLVVTTSNPWSCTSVVSSTFVPVMLGFQANACRACTVSFEAGCASHS